MMHKRIFGPHIGAGTELLYRSQYSHRDDPLWITTRANPDPCVYWRWQGTTGLFFLLGKFKARPLQRCELSEALSPRPSLHRSQIPQKHAATCFVMMRKRIFGPHIGAGTELLYRSQYSHRDDPLWITTRTNPDPCVYWRWQGTTGLFFLLGKFKARPLQRCELSEALSLRRTL